MNQKELVTLDCLENKIKALALSHRENYCIKKCTSEDIEVFGANEYIGGKMHAFEEVLQLIKEI